MAIHPKGILAAKLRVALQIAPRLRNGVGPGGELGPHGLAVAVEPPGLRPIEGELAARQLPAGPQQVLAQGEGIFRAAGEFAKLEARHKVGRCAGYRGTVHGG